MNSRTLEIIKTEFAAELASRRFGKVFQLSRNEIAIDFRLADPRYLYVNFTPGDPRAYLISRRLKDLEKASGNPSPFALTLRKRVSGGEVTGVERLAADRVLKFSLKVESDLGLEQYGLIVQLTGRSSNVFLADDKSIILDRSRETAGEGQQIGERYSTPERGPARNTGEPEGLADRAVATAASPSEALDAFYSEQAAEKKFLETARAATAKVSSETKKREKLIGRLNADLAAHGNADEWKHLGDLLLANATTSRRNGAVIYVTDYFDENEPEVAIDAEENLSVTEAAEKYYRRYTKARNGASEIAARIKTVSSELSKFEKQMEDIRRAIEETDLTALENYASGGRPRSVEKARGKTVDAGSAARTFFSSDGFEVLVGKKARDNDTLTFKVAKSLDTWLHAADYPGSHVVIRNPNRKEIPQQTLLEAAQLAAFYSQGKAQTKAAVHYTLKKFVNKPKGSAPGLVSLASFKTLLVVPVFPDLPNQ